MRFTNVSGYNVKGHNFNIDLGPLTVLAGPSKSGKSAVLDALTVGAIGYHPRLGKTNAATFQLASADAMSVVLTTSEGARTERAWQRKGNSVSTSHVVGHGLGDFPPVMLDAKDYFERSPEQRLQLVFTCLNMTSVPLKERIAEVSKILTAHNVGVIIPDRNTFPEIPNENFQQWLERLINVVGDQRRAKESELKKFTSTTQTLGQQIVQAAEPNLPADYEEQLAAASLHFKEKAKVYNDLDAAHKVYNERHQARLALQLQADKLRPRAESVAKLKKDLAEANNRVGDPVNVTELGLDLDAARQKYYQCEQIRNSATQKFDDTKATMDEVLAQSKCPTCFNNQPTWKTRVRKKFQADLEELQVQKDSAYDRFTQAREAMENAAKAFEQGQKTVQQRASAEHERDALQYELDNALEAEKSLADIEAAIAKLNGSFDVEAFYRAECEMQDAEEAYNELEGLRQHVANHNAAQKELETAAATRDAVTKDAADLKKVETILRDVRNNFMASEFGPFLNIANLFTKDILDTPLEYSNNELGRRDPASGRWITAATFSGAETAATHAAISAALGAQAPVKIAVVDELQRMDAALKRLFVINVGKAINDGVLDQFVGADVDGTVYEAIRDEADSGALNLGTYDGKKQIRLQLLNLK